MKQKYDVYFDDTDSYGKRAEATDKKSENYLDKMNESLRDVGVPNSVKRIFEK